MNNIKVCEHCGQELQKASEERHEIQQTQLNNIDKVGEALSARQTKMDDALIARQDKIDAASQEMLDIIQRIEAKVGADEQTAKDVKELELRIRARIASKAEDNVKLNQQVL